MGQTVFTVLCAKARECWLQEGRGGRDWGPASPCSAFVHVCLQSNVRCSVSGNIPSPALNQLAQEMRANLESSKQSASQNLIWAVIHVLLFPAVIIPSIPLQTHCLWQVSQALTDKYSTTHAALTPLQFLHALGWSGYNFFKIPYRMHGLFHLSVKMQAEETHCNIFPHFH